MNFKHQVANFFLAAIIAVSTCALGACGSKADYTLEKNEHEVKEEIKTKEKIKETTESEEKSEQKAEESTSEKETEKEEDKSKESKTEKTGEKATSELSDENYDPATAVDADGQKVANEIAEAFFKEPLITLDGQQYQLPLTVNLLKKGGWQVAKSPQFPPYDENLTVGEMQENQTVVMTKESAGRVLIFLTYTPVNKPETPIADAYAYLVSITGYPENPEDPEYELFNKFYIGDRDYVLGQENADLIKRYGKSNSLYPSDQTIKGYEHMNHNRLYAGRLDQGLSFIAISSLGPCPDYEKPADSE